MSARDRSRNFLVLRGYPLLSVVDKEDNISDGGGLDGGDNNPLAVST